MVLSRLPPGRRRKQEPISVALLALHYITRVASRPSAFLPLTPSTLTLLLLSSLVLANKYLNDRICSNRRWARWLRAEGVTGERITAGEREVLRGLGYSLECKVDAWEGLVGQAADLAKSHELTLGQRSSNIKPVSESVAAAIRQAAQLASLQHSALAAAISVTASKRKAAQEVYPFVAAKHTQQAAAAQQALRLLYPLRVPVVPVVSVVLPGITTQQQPSYLTPPVTPEGNPSPISLYDNRIDFASALAGAVSKMPLSFQVPKMLPTPPSDGISPAIQAWFA